MLADMSYVQIKSQTLKKNIVYLTFENGLKTKCYILYTHIVILCH
jgi:hypothetical protein